MQDRTTNKHLGYAIVEVPPEVATELQGTKLEIETLGLPKSESSDGSEETTASERTRYKTRLADVTNPQSYIRRPGRKLVFTAEIMRSQGGC